MNQSEIIDIIKATMLYYGIENETLGEVDIDNILEMCCLHTNYVAESAISMKPQ